MVPTTPTFDIQTAVYDTLTGDATLMAAITGVFDEVPEGTQHPYIQIGEAVETPDNAHDRFGRQTAITLHVWSNQTGFKEAVEIAEQVIGLLDHQSLTVSNHHTVSVRYEFSQTLRDPDPDIRHVPVRFRVTTEQTS